MVLLYDFANNHKKGDKRTNKTPNKKTNRIKPMNPIEINNFKHTHDSPNCMVKQIAENVGDWRIYYRHFFFLKCRFNIVQLSILNRIKQQITTKNL